MYEKKLCLIELVAGKADEDNLIQLHVNDMAHDLLHSQLGFNVVMGTRLHIHLS